MAGGQLLLQGGHRVSEGQGLVMTARVQAHALFRRAGPIRPLRGRGPPRARERPRRAQRQAYGDVARAPGRAGDELATISALGDAALEKAGIFRLAKERALDTYIVHWSIFVSKALADAHGVAPRNFYPHYYVDGDTSELVRRYIRESVTQVFLEYPDLDGIGLSHGEGMGGVWMRRRGRG